MRTQLRRQAAAHIDHVRDVLKVQEQELKAEAEQVYTLYHTLHTISMHWSMVLFLLCTTFQTVTDILVQHLLWL